MAMTSEIGTHLPALTKFAEAAWKSKKIEPKFGVILSLDPGETTGWAVWRNDPIKGIFLIAHGQLKTWPIEDCVRNMEELFRIYQPEHIVYEIYAVYEWKSADHSWSQIPTVQIIGCILTLAVQQVRSYSAQTAQIAKNFCTDDKLNMWHVYFKGVRHARDAIRHGIYYILFRPS